MTPELIALAAALFFAFTSILSKKGLENSDPVSAATICVLFQSIILGVASLLFVPFNLVLNSAVLIFVLSGFLSAFLGARLEFLALNKVGASMTSSLTSASPLFATVAAMVLLAEIPTVFTAFGTASIVSGVMFLCLNLKDVKAWKTNGIIIALFAAFTHGLASIPRKMALGLVNAPLLGSMIESFSGFIFFAAYLSLTRKKVAFSPTSLKFLSLRSVFNALALSLLLFALSIGSVTTVSPLGETSPLFTIFLSLIFLREVEKVSVRTVVGAILIVAGSALIVMQ